MQSCKSVAKSCVVQNTTTKCAAHTACALARGYFDGDGQQLSVLMPHPSRVKHSQQGQLPFSLTNLVASPAVFDGTADLKSA